VLLPRNGSKILVDWFHVSREANAGVAQKPQAGSVADDERRARNREKAKARREAYRAKHTPEFLQAVSKMSSATTLLREMLNITRDVEFNDEYREILTDTLNRLKAKMDEVRVVLIEKEKEASP